MARKEEAGKLGPRFENRHEGASHRFEDFGLVRGAARGTLEEKGPLSLEPQRPAPRERCIPVSVVLGTDSERREGPLSGATPRGSRWLRT